MSTVRLIAVFAENKPGQTARITALLAEAGVNLRWATIASSGPFGVMKFLVDRPEAALQHLKQKGVMATFLDALAVQVEDRPGAMHAVADLLGQNGINLENTSGYVANNRAVLVIEVHDPVAAQAVLEKQGFRLLTPEQMLTP